MALHVTQCPSCESTFNTSARILGAANGLVRCGACLSVFEANQHFVDLLPDASNDESGRLTPESVFISAPEDYFNPASFLQRSDLQEPEAGEDAITDAAPELQAEPQDDDAGDDYWKQKTGTATDDDEEPESRARSVQLEKSQPPDVNSELDKVDLGNRIRTPELAKSDWQPLPASALDTIVPAAHETRAPGEKTDPPVLFGADEQRDSEFDIFDADASDSDTTANSHSDQARVEEEIQDNNFDIFDLDEPAINWTSEQVEVRDSNFDIYGVPDFDEKQDTHILEQQYFAPEVTILPPLATDSEALAVIREVLGDFDADAEDDTIPAIGDGESVPWGADADEWYLEEDPNAEEHFQQGRQAGEIVILPAEPPPGMHDQGEELDEELIDPEDDLPDFEEADTDTDQSPVQRFEQDLQLGKVVILPLQANESGAPVDTMSVEGAYSAEDNGAPDQDTGAIVGEAARLMKAAVAEKIPENAGLAEPAQPDETTDTGTEALLNSKLDPAPEEPSAREKETDREATRDYQAPVPDAPEPEPMTAGDDNDDHDDRFEESPGQPPASPLPKADPKAAIRARLQDTDLDDEDFDNRLSAENLRAVRGMDDTLEIENRRTGQRVLRVLALLLGCILVLAAALGVVAWQRLPVLALDPGLRPYYQTVCNLLGCQLPVYRNTTLIETNNLMVRSHPTQPNALELTAIFQNQARFEQPFPVLELQFRDLDNRLVESREFMPAEYLPRALQNLSSMPSRSPVQITLQIPDPGPDAVNYQLTFKSEISLP